MKAAVRALVNERPVNASAKKCCVMFRPMREMKREGSHEGGGGN